MVWYSGDDVPRLVDQGAARPHALDAALAQQGCRLARRGLVARVAHELGEHVLAVLLDQLRDAALALARMATAR